MFAVSVNYAAVFVAAVAGWVFGTIWHGVFIARWADALGKTEEQIALDRKQLVVTVMLSFVADFVMAAVLAHLIAAIGPVRITAGLLTAIGCWLGFVLTTIIVNNGYTRDSFALIAVASWHQLGVLLVMGAVIGAFGAS